MKAQIFRQNFDAQNSIIQLQTIHKNTFSMFKEKERHRNISKAYDRPQ